MPMYLIDISMETQVVVVAEDKIAAEQIAEMDYQDMFRDGMVSPDVWTHTEIKELADVPNVWLNCLPYGTSDDQTINEILSKEN